MTAAPGPQQPDEVLGVQPLTKAAARFQLDPSGTTADLSTEQVRTAGQLAMWLRARDRRRCDQSETTYGLAYLLTVAFPAAPSAQPDERRCTCPEDEAGRMVTYTCQRGTEPHSVGCPRWGTPAQPVRDTEEGRR